tara:strand:+ start:1582 stop:1800 length:219 start_codon:yes stop_codon:yes gene_type:complete
MTTTPLHTPYPVNGTKVALNIPSEWAKSPYQALNPADGRTLPVKRDGRKAVIDIPPFVEHIAVVFEPVEEDE